MAYGLKACSCHPLKLFFIVFGCLVPFIEIELLPLTGREMGTLLALVCPCFRKNVIGTCNIVSLLCSLNNFLLKTVFVFIFGIKFYNGAHLKKKATFLTYFSYF